MATEIDWAQIHRALSEPFPPDLIKQRPGRGGQTYDYIDARAVEDRLDTVVGPASWSDDYEIFSADEKAVLCRLTVYGVTKTGVGYPNSERDEEPYKAAESDALKRAAVKFGVGRFLYNLPSHSNGHARGASQTAPAPQAGRGQPQPATKAQKDTLQTLMGELAQLRGDDAWATTVRAAIRELGLSAKSGSDLSGSDVRALLGWGQTQIGLLRANQAQAEAEPAELTF